MLSLCKELRNATGVMAVETLATIREGFVSPSVVATATDLPWSDFFAENDISIHFKRWIIPLLYSGWGMFQKFGFSQNKRRFETF